MRDDDSNHSALPPTPPPPSGRSSYIDEDEYDNYDDDDDDDDDSSSSSSGSSGGNDRARFGESWLFDPDQTTITLGSLHGHEVQMSIATDDDVPAVAAFMADRTMEVKGKAGVLKCLSTVRVSPEHGPEWGQRRLAGARFRSALGTILESCVPGRLAGLIVQIEHGGEVQGVMAMNIVTSKLDDPWSVNELVEYGVKPAPWVFPASYLRILYNAASATRNQNRPILNIPYLIVPESDDLRTMCLIAFSRLLEKIVRRFGRTAVLNALAGPVLDPIIEPYLTSQRGFNQSGELPDDLPGPSVLMEEQPSCTHRIYTKAIRPSPSRHCLYLDDALRSALSGFSMS